MEQRGAGMSEHSSEFVAELQRHIRTCESRADCNTRLRNIEAELAELRGDFAEMRADFQDIASTLTLIVCAVTKQPKPEGETHHDHT
jgi:hypothetical protein